MYGTQADYSLTYNQTIQDAQDNIADDNVYSHVFDCGLVELLPDRLHFNAVGAETVAEGLFQIAKNL